MSSEKIPDGWRPTGVVIPDSGSPSITRRDFVRTSLAVGAAASLYTFGLSRVAAADAPGIPPAPSWVDRPMRWAQLTFVENDPVDIDVGFWMDYFKRTHSDAVCLSGGGCVAYYPTTIPGHHRSAWLGDRDLLGEFVTGCRGLGMVVIVRTDPHATYDDVQAAHPDWIAVDAEGHPRRHWASPEMWVTCGLGPYNFDFMTAVKREIATRYPIDGVFINRWDGSGMCWCEHCRANFRKATGRDLPRPGETDETLQREYLLWRQRRLFDLWQTWDAAVRAINPDACVIPNTGGGATSRLDMAAIGELAPTLMADRQARRGLMAPWAIGLNAKEYRATMGRKPVVGIFSVGVEEPYRWKDSVQDGAEIKLWVADLIANGMRPWFTKFGGVLRDPRWLAPIEEIYRWCHGAERYLRNERSLARVALVYSQQSAWFYARGHAGERIEDPIHGWSQALIESRIPFELVHDRLLDAEHLAAFRTLILPNIAALSDAQCAQLVAFVRRGGSIIATYETSLFDEWGQPRADFGLRDLFGVSFVGRRPGPVRNSYLRLEHEKARGHPLLAGLEEAPRIIHGVWQLDVKPTVAFPNPPVTLIPSYPDLPMEKVYPRVEHTDTPEVLLREFPSAHGAGRVVYFPWDVDRTFWEVLAKDHLTLMRNAVRWATPEDPPVTVEGPGVLDITVWQQRDSLTVHLVNLTNPMMMKGPVRDLLAVGAQKVRVRLPEAGSPTAVKLLVAGTPAEVTRTGAVLELTVPSLLAHEVIAIDLAPRTA